MAFVKSEAPELQDVQDWLNTGPVDITEGVYLLNFWSSSCLNCRRNARKVQQIHESCADITAIGVHVPDFSFEKDTGNVRQAVEQLGLDHPVALDPERSAWRAYGNHNRPVKLLLDDGRIAWKQVGDSFEGLEQKISGLTGTETGIQVSETGFPGSFSETCLGYHSGENLNQEPVHPGEKTYSSPSNRKPGTVYLDGEWNRKEEFLEAGESARLHFVHRNSGISAVAGAGGSIKDIEVLVNSRELGEDEVSRHLRQENGRSYIRVKNSGVYHLVEPDTGLGEITLLPEPGTRLYALSTSEPEL